MVLEQGWVYIFIHCYIFVHPDLDLERAIVCWDVEKVRLFVQIYMYISESWSFFAGYK